MHAGVGKPLAVIKAYINEVSAFYKPNMGVRAHTPILHMFSFGRFVQVALFCQRKVWCM